MLSVPRCGKPVGLLKDGGSGRFRYYVICGSCAFMTDPARTAGVAVQLRNEAKLAPKRL